MDVIRLIEGGNNIFHLYACIIQDIKRIIQMNWDVRICHTLREGNGCADIRGDHKQTTHLNSNYQWAGSNVLRIQTSEKDGLRWIGATGFGFAKFNPSITEPDRIWLI